MITIDNIHKSLPYLNKIRRMYSLSRSTGTAPAAGYIRSVIARADKEDNVTISIYSFNEGMSEVDYYMTGKCSDVTEIIIAWAFPWKYNGKIHIPDPDDATFMVEKKCCGTVDRRSVKYGIF